MAKRRDLFKAMAAGAVVAPLPGISQTAQAPCPRAEPRWARGIEGQRKADLGDGRFLNPIVSGDRPDPSILRDGFDYYMTFSSFLSYPGLVIWHSTDLVNWMPIGPALHHNLGNIWAPDLCKHGSRYYLYFPANPRGSGWTIHAIWTDDIRGRWSDPVDLGIADRIDPGHVVGEDGKRYLFFNGIRKVRLSDDGLATDGELEDAYDPWRYPDEWTTDSFAPEGPKLLWREGWLYLVTAVGGTAGPPTGHMVIVARSRSVHGPWKHCPHNPLVRTRSPEEAWWSRGHATLVQGPADDWWMVYHGYENGYRTLGRQTLLEPVEWTADGWFRALGDDLSQPLRKPAAGRTGPHGMALSDDFSSDRFGVQWSFHQPGPDETARLSRVGGGLMLHAAGASPTGSPPLVCLVGDRAYEAELQFDLDPAAEGGLLLYYDEDAFVGLGFTRSTMKTWQYGRESPWLRRSRDSASVRVRLTNDGNIVSCEFSEDGGDSWTRHDKRMEVSGMHHNVYGGFLSLRIGIYSAGEGAILLRRFGYRAFDVTRPV